MPKRRKSLRRRLTLWMVLVWGIIQGTVVLLILLYEGAAVDRFFDDRLKGRSLGIGAEIRPLLPDLTDVQLEQIAIRNTDDYIMFKGFALVVYANDGRIIASSDQPAPPYNQICREDQSAIEAGRAFLTDSYHFASLREAPGKERMVLVGIEDRDQQEYELLVVTTDAAARGLTARLQQVLIIALAAGLVGAATSAWIISGVATEPLKRVLDSMRKISPGTVGQEVRMDGGSEELAVVRREVDAMRSRMEAGFKAQERFLSNVSHEIKTPISVLLTEMQTLPSLGETPGDVREFIVSVGEELRRLGGMVESFLLLTRVRDGQPVQARIGTYQVNELIVDSMESCAGIAEQYEVSLVPILLDDPEDLDLTVNGIPDLLRTMLDNLVRNAVRFSPEHGRVIITARRPSDSEVTIEVRDFGTGIPPGMLDTIFDRFAQNESEVKRGRGHGLGLEIALGIAEIHGGGITVENCEDRGCRFIVRLPIGDNPAASRVRGGAPDQEIENHPDDRQK